MHPDGHGPLGQPLRAIELPVLKAKVAILVQVACVAGRKENAVENLLWIDRAFVPTQDGLGAVAAILPMLMGKVALGVVIADEWQASRSNS